MRSITRFISLFGCTIFGLYLVSWESSQSSYAQELLNQVDKTTEQSSLISETLRNGIILAVISATLGFITNIIVENVKRRNEPRKQLSYSQIIKSGIVGTIEPDIANKVSVSYNGKPARNMYYAIFNVENTGNKQVNDCKVRFEFTEGSEILDVFFDPEPIPEIELEILKEGVGSNEAKYNIGFLKPKEQVGFRFIVKGIESNNSVSKQSNDIVLSHYFHNSNGDVKFILKVPREVGDDIKVIKSFTIVCLGILIFIPLIRNIIFYLTNNSPFSDLFASLAALIGFVILILPRLEGFIRVLFSLASLSNKSTLSNSNKN